VTAVELDTNSGVLKIFDCFVAIKGAGNFFEGLAFGFEEETASIVRWRACGLEKRGC
jgi:hypothetical protein